MKKIILLVVTMFMFASCNNSTVKEEKNVLMENDTYALSLAEVFPGMGEAVALPLEVSTKIAQTLADNGHFPASDVDKVTEVLQKFFPAGGMLTLWHKIDKNKNFGLMYYKSDNSVRVSMADYKTVKAFYLNKDNQIKKIEDIVVSE